MPGISSPFSIFSTISWKVSRLGVSLSASVWFEGTIYVNDGIKR